MCVPNTWDFDVLSEASVLLLELLRNRQSITSLDFKTELRRRLEEESYNQDIYCSPCSTKKEIFQKDVGQYLRHQQAVGLFQENCYVIIPRQDLFSGHTYLEYLPWEFLLEEV